MSSLDAEILRITETYCDICKYLHLTKIQKIQCLRCNKTHQICNSCLSDKTVKCSVRKKSM